MSDFEETLYIVIATIVFIGVWLAVIAWIVLVTGGKL